MPTSSSKITDALEGRIPPKVFTGVPELDAVLQGGLTRGRSHLLEGHPGTGKTTMAMQFLVEGLARGDRGLYITLSETRDELIASAASHGWSLEGIEIKELEPEASRESLGQTILEPGELDLDETVDQIIDAVEHARVDRVVIDSLAEIRLLAVEGNRYRRQVMTLRRRLMKTGVTALLINDVTDRQEYDLQAMMHGVIAMEVIDRDYGAARRRLRVVKMRGAEFQSGWHDFAIKSGEVLVFPSLIAQEHGRPFEREIRSTGHTALDEMLGGGNARGSTTIFTGPSGVGKSSLATQILTAASARGENGAYFSFDESYESAASRAEQMGLELSEAVNKGFIHWERVTPSRISPGEFVWKVRRQVEDRHAETVVIDSLNSYLQAMPEEQALMLQMHELLSYLANQGVVVILVLAQKGILERLEAPIDLSFLSDAVLALRFYQRDGKIHRAMSVIKKRAGPHDNSIRTYSLTGHGIVVGDTVSDIASMSAPVF